MKIYAIRNNRIYNAEHTTIRGVFFSAIFIVVISISLIAFADSANLTVEDGWDSKNAKTLQNDGKTFQFQTSDDDRFAVEKGGNYYVSTVLSNPSIPGSANITSVIVYCEHYEENGFGTNDMVWKVGTGGQNFTTWASNNTIPRNIGSGNEALDSWDVSSVVDTPTEVQDLEFAMQNDSNNKLIFVDYVYAVVTWTAPNVDGSTSAVTTTTVISGQSDALILDLTLTNSVGTADALTSITLNNAGTATDSEISSVKLYSDSNNSNDYTSGVDSLVTSGNFTSGAVTFSGLNVTVPASGSEDMFVIFDVANTVADGKTLDVSIPINGMSFTNAPDAEDVLLNSTGTRTVDLVLDHFVISHDNVGTAGTAENVSVTAADNNGNTITDYTGTITVDTNGTTTSITWAKIAGGGTFTDGGASVDTATYTFVSGDNGVVTLSVNDTIAETLNISVTGDSKSDDDTEGNMVFSPGVIDHFVISHDNAAVAGVADQVTVTAKDANENNITNYTGTTTIDTNGTATTITWAKVTGGGTFTDGGASVDTATYTFDVSDNGSASFSVLDTTAETLDISVTGDSKSDDNTEGNLVVAPAAIDYFIVAHDNAANAGIAENVTITAKDQYANTKTDYTGNITVDTNGTANTITWVLITGAGTFSDGGASVDTATYTYNASDNGVVTLSINDTKTETINISVSGDSKVDDDTEGTLVINPGVLDHFTITHDGTNVVGTEEDMTVTAYDVNNNVKSDYTGTITLDTNGTATTITWSLVTGNGTFTDGGASVDTATYTYVGSDNGVTVINISNTSVETLNISISGDGKTDDDTEGNMQFEPVGVNYFVISHDNSALSSSAENITITVKDFNDDTVTDYTGTITVDTNTITPANITWALVTGDGTFTDGGGGVDTATYTYNTSDIGVVVLSLTDTSEETINIATTGDGKSDDNTEGDLVVNPVGLHHFVLSHDSQADAGSAESITITAKDANENPVTDYIGTVTVDTNGTATTITWAKQTGNGSFSEGGPSVDTATYTFVASDNGVAVLTINDTSLETINISVAGGGKTDDDTEGTLAVGPGTIDHFVITHDTAATAGVADNVTIRAEDAFNNVKTNYLGTITVDTNGTATTIAWAKVTGDGTFTDGGASVDTATYTFLSSDNGQVTLSINDTTAESLNISVSGDSKSDDDSEGNLVVGPTSIGHFVISHDNNAEAGVAENITVTAYDTYANTKDDYTGTITVDTNGTATTITWAKVTGGGTFTDGGASVDTATYTFLGSDNGIVVLSISDTVKETINIQVSGDLKTDDDTEGNLTVGATAIDHFVLSHDASAIAGTADNVTVTAYDTYSNLKDDYTGTVTMDTNGTATTITWALVTGGGTFTDGGASVDTATYTYVGGDNGVATLSISDTVTESLNISAADGVDTDDDTEGNLIVHGGALDHFLIEHDGSASTGAAEQITIKAIDTFSNVKDNYTGTITVDTTGTATTITWSLQIGDGTFTDGGASVDTATYAYVSADAGIVKLGITNTVNETLNISVSGDSKSDENTEGDVIFVNTTVIVDNTDADFSIISGGGDWITEDGGDGKFVTFYGSNNLYASANKQSSLVRWAPNLTYGGSYEVFFYWPSAGSESGTSNADFRITHVGGTDTLSVNQSTNGSQWNSQGTYSFISGTSGNVELDGVAGGQDYMLADAVRLILMGSADAIAQTVTSSSVPAGTSDVLITHVCVTNNATVNDTITSVQLENVGTISDAEISSVKLYSDSNNSGDYTSGVDTQVGTGSFASGTKTFSGLNITVAKDGGTEDLFAVVDVANTVTDGDVIDVKIPINGITMTNASTLEDTDLNSSGTKTVDLVLDHFVISHDGSASAGVADNVSVTAKDNQGNTITDYAGTVQLDTNGTATAITWALVTGNGTLNDGGASVDTATYEFNTSDNGTATFSITAENVC